jgi:hypothetical protein
MCMLVCERESGRGSLCVYTCVCVCVFSCIWEGVNTRGSILGLPSPSMYAHASFMKNFE